MSSYYIAAHTMVSQSGGFSHHCTLNFTAQRIAASVSLGCLAPLIFCGVQSVIVEGLVLQCKTTLGESKEVELHSYDIWMNTLMARNIWRRKILASTLNLANTTLNCQ